ncbi:hypothetical protein Nepgr_019085 [Nepenthes gracilis]|uniref:Flap endonuclease GEN-like 1 n=1 Tax=Nepenthes gracilis TaxID=150966 RepID=A0AAD3SUR8_NEPGR|nr:hypothetical protein Nepgr_019085 [Nepenthes gracilis]
MGVGGNFWEILKPYARYEGFDFARNKRVAVDLSFWIVQHETAVKYDHVRNPHLRLTFFRTVNLFSKFGAFPVFIVDGTPSPLKSQARIVRFFRSSGIDLSSLLAAEERVSVERNQVFQKSVEDCMELLKLLGMPVLKAKGEAEALCAQLNYEGQVDACITADSDAFLYGAKCVIKCLRPNSKEPFECYHMADIEDGLGLRREHLIAISLLVGNDHDLGGVQGIGLDTALRFVKCFNHAEVLNSLREIGSGSTSLFERSFLSDGEPSANSDKIPQKKIPHCSFCGHPGNKKSHCKVACKYCCTTTESGCSQKPAGFKCDCSSCDMVHKESDRKKNENWQVRVCRKIAMEQNFPNNDIIEMYCSDKNASDCPGPISWKNPETDMLVDFLVYHQLWEPSYIRLRMLPMMSTIFLKEMAANRTEALLYGQYEFDSIQRLKIRYGHRFYVVRWKKSSCMTGNINHSISSKDSLTQPDEIMQVDESVSILDELDIPQVHVDDGCSFLLTDENTVIVRDAFPEKVNSFLQKKEAEESKRCRKRCLRSNETHEKFQSPDSKGFQVAITEYYPSTKILNQAKGDSLARSSENPSGIGSSKRRSVVSVPNLSKSVRRRLLFN